MLYITDPEFEIRQQERWHERQNYKELLKSGFFYRNKKYSEESQICPECGVIPKFKKLDPEDVNTWKLYCKCHKKGR